ncbi:sensor histidine kinase [Paenibacillus hamazuiensis]|uniref:sensor histidine kinase n=1 Tax=Paenibacillus hamazuiensis TaxID=2936508 RepID=UPI00200C4B16|nr:ATP-binding protein [Paenibacillus hamazuiensis]
MPKITNLFYEPSTKLVIAFFLLGIVVNLLFLSYLYFKYRKENSYASTIIKTVWWSFIVSFSPFVCLSFIPQLLWRDDFVSSLYTGWFVLILPISFAYLIMSKQLYDIQLVLRRLVFTMILSVIPSGIITGLAAVIFERDASPKHLVFIFFLTLIILTFVLYSLEYFATKLEAVIFPRKHNLQLALKKISTNLQTISSFRELKEMILTDIVQTLQVFGGALAFQYKDTIETICEGEIRERDVEALIRSGTGTEMYTCLEINRHEEFTSYLVMTRKKTNTLLGKEEVQWLTLIVSYLAVSLENMHLIRKLNMKLRKVAAYVPNELTGQDFIWYRKLMFELQETERSRIVTELYDSTMQDLDLLKQRLASAAGSGTIPPKEAKQVRSIMDYVEVMQSNLRHRCFELYPSLLSELGLIRTVNKLMEDERAACPFELDFSADNAEAVEGWDMDTKRHLYRIIQELLSNAKKHSKATIVTFLLLVIDNEAHLHYHDDGIGFDPVRIETGKLSASGAGLAQMRSRVLHLDGHLELKTSEGCGLRMRIIVPLNGKISAVS